MIVCNMTAEWDAPSYDVNADEDMNRGAILIKINNKLMAKVPCPHWKWWQGGEPDEATLTEAVIQWMTGTVRTL